MSSTLAKQQKFGNTGIKISPIVVGCMSYGSKQYSSWMEEDKEKVFKVLKYCYDHGLRTFDTADVYSNGASERLLGEFLKAYNIKRETVIIMTKIFFPVDETLDPNFRRNLEDKLTVLEITNQQGLSRKHIMAGVKNSVERLGTYIDILQIHRFDPNTPIKETMKALNDVIEIGDVRYIGASSMRPTQFVEMQAIAEKYDYHQFVNVQSCYNLLYREDERDLNLYCQEHNVALTPWSPNSQGILTRPIGTQTERFSKDAIVNAWGLNKLPPADTEIVNRVEKLAKEKNISMATLSTAWVSTKGCFPIVGMSKIERVDDALAALEVTFTEEELKYLEEPYVPKSFLY
ncbi:similar to Saccharomyces cerevisiae YPL088W Putative aryl alcohol dehydrogenase [Maudiozyma saulgeensis]|uniref:Similar to Saccharomyces cerevisiae YPL088W Putative aryl alcohol dehydrogenase n=1 Tax=Maudiozyma saulgeensis TaxID=1789683 RepID=A0A1X7R840_9SACH|nr:similar to Saccharomyces cerevisiae YPL088W Putative aryl alcohol dehydrogenase [Kazachstania saulgeensis]